MAKKTFNKVKRQPKKWEKIFANQMSKNGLISKTILNQNVQSRYFNVTERENQCVFYFYSEKIIRKIPEKKKAN